MTDDVDDDDDDDDTANGIRGGAFLIDISIRLLLSRRSWPANADRNESFASLASVIKTDSWPL